MSQLTHITGRVARVNYNEERETLSLVVPSTERYTNKQGEKVEETEWFVIKLFKPRAPKIKDWIKKGMLVTASGKIKTSAYLDRHGNPKAEIRVMAKDFEFFNMEPKTTSEFNNNLKKQAQDVDVDDDDLPF
jgi:single stranded DNA-binding protein